KNVTAKGATLMCSHYPSFLPEAGKRRLRRRIAGVYRQSRGFADHPDPAVPAACRGRQVLQLRSDDRPRLVWASRVSTGGKWQSLLLTSNDGGQSKQPSWCRDRAAGVGRACLLLSPPGSASEQH